MPVRLYETLFLLDSTKVATDPDGSRNALHNTIQKFGGEILVTRPWDENRKLAYAIDKQKKGYYQAVYYKFESTKQVEMEREFKLNETVLRLLTSAIDPKWEDTMLEIARNDTSIAFAHRGMQDETAPTDITPNIGAEGGPPLGGDAMNAATGGRRPPRREYADKPE